MPESLARQPDQSPEAEIDTKAAMDETMGTLIDASDRFGDPGLKAIAETANELHIKLRAENEEDRAKLEEEKAKLEAELGEHKDALDFYMDLHPLDKQLEAGGEHELPAEASERDTYISENLPKELEDESKMWKTPAPEYQYRISGK